MAKSKKKASKKRPLKKKLKRRIRSARKTVRKKAKKTVRKIAKKIVKARARQAKAKTARVPKTAVRQEAIPLPPPQPASPKLQEGQPAPDFTVQTDDGRTVSLGDFRGKKVVLYFYPKDDTPGCTVEACAFRDGIAQIKARGAEVLGVSVDDANSHQKFKEKHQLNFPLLADTDKKLVQDYGVWKEKNMYGRTYMGIDRTTFLIDENGTIRKIFPKVDVNAHYEEVLRALG
jgi:peroxiredoxin Q/BCP